MKKLLKHLKIKKQRDKNNEIIVNFFVDYSEILSDADYDKNLTSEDYNGKVQ